VRRLLRGFGWFVGGVVPVLVVLTLATARFGDATLYPPPPGQPSVEIIVVTNLYHSGIILPREAVAEVARRQNLAALTAVTARFADFPRLEFGWGDEGFYTRVPTTNELTMGLALRALFRPGHPTVLHVVGLSEHPRQANTTASMAVLSVSEAGFGRLAAMLDRTFARTGLDRGIEELGRGLYGPSLFYRAVGSFNLLRVCNHWIADLLDAAGVPTAPVLATLPQGLLWDLSWRAGAQRLAPPLRGMSAS
jgi:uncharacterized protein (TIGR02117 family)